MSPKRKADEDIPSGKPTKSPRLEGQEQNDSSDEEQKLELARQARRERAANRNRLPDSDSEDEYEEHSKPSTTKDGEVAAPGAPAAPAVAAATKQHKPAVGPKLKSASKRKRAPVEKPAYRGNAGGPRALAPQTNKGNVTKAQDKPSKAQRPVKVCRQSTAKPTLTFSDALKSIEAKTAALKPETSTATTKDVREDVTSTGSAPKCGTKGPSTKRKAEETADPPVKKAKVEDVADEQDSGVPGQRKSASTPTTSDSKAGSKRSAEEDTASPAAKRTKVQAPAEANSDKVKNLGAQGARREKTSRASRAKDSKKAGNQPVKQPGDKASVLHSSDEIADGQVWQLNPITIHQADISKASSLQQGQTQSKRVLPPARMENNENCCFANVVFQILDSVPELRQAMITKYQEGKKAKQPESLSAHLGRLFADMEEAAAEGRNASAKSFLQAFGKRNEMFDGRSQQDVYECMEKLLQQLDEGQWNSEHLSPIHLSISPREYALTQSSTSENNPAESASSSGPGFAKGLFSGKQVSRRDGAETNPCSLPLGVPAGHKGRKATILDCIQDSFKADSLEDLACHKCGSKDHMEKQEVVQDWGKYLLLLFDRVRQNGRKIGTKLPIPNRVKLGKHQFEVLAFAEHKGYISTGGHYYVSRKVGDRWFLCNDEEMREIAQADQEKYLAATWATHVLLRKE
ncbi:MAG: hypothetical protein Q9174_003270 [Haloplaca sp. 1 TL-2023]